MWFMDAMDVVMEVHSAAKTAWSVLSQVYKLAEQPLHLDSKFQDLLQKMNDTYERVCDSQELRKVRDQPGAFRGREQALRGLCEQTAECGRFILKYAQDEPRFSQRLESNMVWDVDKQLVQYIQRLDVLQEAFRAGIQLHMEMVTDETLEQIKNHVIDMDIRKIPLVGGAEFEPEKQCLGTSREALLDDIAIWASDDAEDSERAFLLMGLAGTGKSTIAHTVADLFDEMDRLGASFFFDAMGAENRRAVDLFRNIAHALARRHRSFRDALWTELGEERLYTTRDIQEQFDIFLLRPARKLRLCSSVLIVVDALDESGTPEERKQLVSIIRDRLQELPSTFRFLITCREEADIIMAFPESTHFIVVQRLPTVDPSLSEDILKYIKHSLRSVLADLPEKSCEILADASGGLFQWADVAVQYIIGTQLKGSPADRYAQIITQGKDPASTHPEAGIYDLYRIVLSRIFNHDQDPSTRDISSRVVGDLSDFKAVMGTLLVSSEPLSMRALDTLLKSWRPEQDLRVYDVLRNLGSLLSGVGEHDVPIRPLSASFVEFLQDPAVGREFAVGTAGHHETLATAALRLLDSSLHFNMGGHRTSYLLNPEILSVQPAKEKLSAALLYACKYWGYHLSKSAAGFTATVRHLIDTLFQEKFLFWMEVASIGGSLGDTVHCISMAMGSFQSKEEHAYNAALDGLEFMKRFSPVIAESAAHIYLSALIWAPQSSPLANVFRQRSACAARVSLGLPSSWVGQNQTLHDKESIWSVAFSPDGNRIVSGSYDKTIRVWDAQTGMMIGESPKGQATVVYSLAFSPDYKWIVSGSGDNTIRLWDGEIGEARGEQLSGHEGAVYSVAFSPDSKWILSGSGDKTIRMWDVEKKKAHGEPLFGHDGAVYSVAFSPEGRRIVSGSADRTIRVWNETKLGWIGAPLHGHRSAVYSVVFSPDGRRIVSGSGDHTLRVWDAASGTAIGKPLTGHADTVTSVTFSPDGNRIVSGSDDHTIRIWEGETGAAVGVPLEGHEGGVSSVAFSPDSKRVLSGSYDGTSRVWIVEAEEQYSVSDQATSFEMSTNVARQKNFVGRGGNDDSRLRVWNNDRFALSTFKSHQLNQIYHSGTTPIRLDRKTGWILGNEKDRILWVPPDLHNQISLGALQMIIPGPPAIYVDLSKFVHGEEWTKCWTPASEGAAIHSERSPNCSH
ncbi:hypothetical protein CALCODRAFT_229473 [Calocera cornea HHB12733]|uniref:NACHT domain-containing protein n=1 Tax=Calocera cornea HHB12733 TaxID=1353952 RepID=A0A165C0K0_9BASI|nr:hypothetical protein CALCODRAFT_229473 [Calocera cornea HHB12733]